MYQNSYQTARSILGFVTVIGWIAAGIGVIVLLMAISAMGADRYGPGEAVAIARGVSGGLAFVGGLVTVAFAQVQFATLDQADISREMLRLMRSESTEGDADRGPSPAPDVPAGRAQMNEQFSPDTAGKVGVKGAVSRDTGWQDGVYHRNGYSIEKVGYNYRVRDDGTGKQFPTLGKAKDYIDRLPSRS